MWDIHVHVHWRAYPSPTSTISKPAQCLTMCCENSRREMQNFKMATRKKTGSKSASLFLLELEAQIDINGR